jgi:hypothetical protein
MGQSEGKKPLFCCHAKSSGVGRRLKPLLKKFSSYLWLFRQGAPSWRAGKAALVRRSISSI